MPALPRRCPSALRSDRPARAVFRGVALALALSAAAGPALALTYRPQTPVSVAASSERVVVATIETAQRTFTAEGAEIDVLTLSVHETWRGPRTARLRVRQVRTVQDADRGGRAMIAGNPVLEAGATYLLFLPPELELPQVPATVAGENGAYRAVRGAAGWSFRTLDGRAVVDVGPERIVLDAPPDPRMVYPPGQSPLPSRPAADLASRWRALVARAGAK